ncbi:MAG: DUF1553 domain-containing protein [Kiritimatiellae bacterium]|nr:DUF1553 domain-containing protein [Kiritimatiellia bacterium]
MKPLILTVVLLLAALANNAVLAADRDVFESPASATPESRIDRIVSRNLSKLRIPPPPLCSDAVFVRRVFLDTIGTLPAADEAREFIHDQTPDKRGALVDRLLERSEFADYWAMKWGDILKIKAEFPVNLWPNAAQAYHRWVWVSLHDNKPYGRFVREMLTSSGSNFRVGQVNFYRAMQNKTPEGIAASVALAFMGARTDRWPKDRLAGMAAFFSQVAYKPTREWKEEIVFRDPDREPAAPTGQPASQISTNNAARQTGEKTALPAPTQTVRALRQEAVFPDGTRLKRIPPGKDPREIFADWLITPKNAWFTGNIVNRIWAWLLGRGIIHEPDDIRPDNPPSNPELLAFLQSEFTAHNYDMKHICRLILKSSTYQFSSIPPKPDVPGAEANFAFYPLRRLDAEVLIDAINKVTGTSELYTSPIPEPFSFIPEDKRAITLPDGSITSPFLELFGRPARATGMENERVNRASPIQRMHMLNSSHIQRKLEQGPKLKKIIKTGRTPREIMENIYLTILSRFPTDDERKIAADYAGAGAVKGREAWIDLAWVLINSDEFLYRH